MSWNVGMGKVGRVDNQHMRQLLELYFIAGSQNCLSHRDLGQTVKEAIDGGITIFQFREKGPEATTGSERYALALAIRELCKVHSIPFIVNDDIELALAVDADGIHIGQGDASAHKVRELIGDKILGVSVHDLEQVKAAIAAGADYVGAGPVFPTSSKDDAEPVQGISLITAIRETGLTIPIVAIGGITAERATPIIQAGADGIAVISAISEADSAREAAVELRRVVASV